MICAECSLDLLRLTRLKSASVARRALSSESERSASLRLPPANVASIQRLRGAHSWSSWQSFNAAPFQMDWGAWTRCAVNLVAFKCGSLASLRSE